MSKLQVVELHNRAPAARENLSEGEQVARVIEAMKTLYGEAWRALERASPRALELDALLRTVDSVASQLAALPARLLEFADLADVADAVDKLVGCYPQRAPDPEAYAEGLVEEIASIRPGRAGLAGGVRELFKTSKYLPSRSELRAAIIGAQEAIADLPRRLQYRRDEIQAARHKLEQARIFDAEREARVASELAMRAETRERWPMWAARLERWEQGQWEAAWGATPCHVLCEIPTWFVREWQGGAHRAADPTLDPRLS